MNLLDLARDMEQLAKELPDKVSKLAADAALAIVGDLSFVTPVDTSQALSNWQLTLNSPATGSISPHYPGVKGSTQKPSAQESIANAKKTLADKKPGETIYITNNLPYINRLNEGYSGQAPAGFVERSLLIGNNVINKFKV